MARVRHERWLERIRLQDTGVPFGSHGWCADPSGKHRLRYLDGRSWTAWVANDGDAFVDDGPVQQ